VDNLNHEVTRYWDFVIEPFDSLPQQPERVWGEQLNELLTQAVKRRLMSDVPLGVFLSGGIDSSSITAVASKHVGAGTLRTFSIGFEEASFDESTYSNAIASLFKTNHHHHILSLEAARQLLPEIRTRLDEPMGDSSILPTYLLCRETRKHVTVAVGGDGADELFAGYDPFRALKLAETYCSLVAKPLHHAIALVISRFPTSHSNMSFDFRMKRTIRGLSYPKTLWNSVWLGPLQPKELDDLFAEKTDIEEVYSEAIEQWERCGPSHIVDRTLQFYTKLYLQDDILVKVDRASMMNSLEVRAPFLDIDLVDFVRRIPHQYKYRNGKTKYILKKTLERLLPEQTINRSKKGFGVPIGKWFRDGALPFDSSASHPMLNSTFISRAMREHRLGKVDHRAFLWNLWLLAKWSDIPIGSS
jgi:asparagine synthase (glutamine-hydrolysing)